jgi:hypothetical protein
MAAVTVEPGRAVDWSVHNSTRVADSALTPHCPVIQPNNSNNPIQRMEQSKGTPSPLSNPSARSLAYSADSDSGRPVENCARPGPGIEKGAMETIAPVKEGKT